MALRVVLEIPAGPFTGRKIELRLGQTASVGRTSRAQYAIPHDALLASVHFVLEWEGDICRIRDLASVSGLLVNGYRVTRTPLRQGDEIVAGSTTFFVRYEEDVRREPGPSRDASYLPSSSSAASPEERLLDALRFQYQPLFAILDAARDPRVLKLLKASDAEYKSLYEGVQAEVLADCAPYLVSLPLDSFLEGLVREAWGQSWGIYLTSREPFREVRKHFRHFLLVKRESGEELYFRFYDPRVLRVFLPTCSPAQAIEFFGPVSHYVVEAEPPDTLLKFTNTPQGPRRETFSLVGQLQHTG